MHTIIQYVVCGSTFASTPISTETATWNCQLPARRKQYGAVADHRCRTDRRTPRALYPPDHALFMLQHQDGTHHLLTGYGLHTCQLCMHRSTCTEYSININSSTRSSTSRSGEGNLSQCRSLWPTFGASEPLHPYLLHRALFMLQSLVCTPRTFNALETAGRECTNWPTKLLCSSSRNLISVRARLNGERTHDYDRPLKSPWPYPPRRALFMLKH